jgi:hypothetical protein
LLLSTPIPVEPGQCYRLSVREKADSGKMGTLLLQVDWKDENNQDATAPDTRRVNPRSARHSSRSSMTVSAPQGAKYAVVRAQAASGKIWVDDYSFKQIPSDCEPVLFVTPDPVLVAAGQPGRAAVSWDACCSAEGRVTVTTNDNREELFATGQSGLAFLDRIEPDAHYELRLY